MNLEDIMEKDEFSPGAPQPQAGEQRPEGETVEEFRNDLRKLINHHSKENGSDTPDFILADYLVACLAGFDAATKARDAWYGGRTLDEGKV